jgi:hypothetical protein
LGHPEAGSPEFGPYPTYLRLEISGKRLAELARETNLDPVYTASYRIPLGLPAGLDALWSAATKVGRMVTFGTWDAGSSEHVAVFRRR